MTSSIDQQSQAISLIPFTGFYMLDADIGSFVMIDSVEFCTASGVGEAFLREYFGKVTISTDGQTSAMFPLAANCTFDGKNLVIADKEAGINANLNFSNASGSGSLSGTINNVEVTGSTPFGPVPLSSWIGSYYSQLPVTEQDAPPADKYGYSETLRVDPNGTVHFASEAGFLKPVSSYSYDYGMFVIGLSPASAAPDASPPLFEMGTASGWGRVAGNASDGQMLVSIRLQEPVPNL